MKITRTLGLVLVVALAFGTYQLVSAQDKSSPPPTQERGWFCPWAGQSGMGPGMMWNRGDWDGPRGWGPGGMMGPGPDNSYRSYNRTGEPVTLDQAKVLVENHLTTAGNPNLKSGKFTDKGKYFEAEIVTKEGSLVDKLMVDKQTGWMKSVY
jgi:hypothetical protein